MPIELSEQDRTKNKTKEEVVLRGIKTPMTLESQMRKFNRFMIREIRTRFENQVLKKLQVKTLDKFEDAQIGNYAVVFDRLVKNFERKINKQFSKEKINKFVKKLYNETNSFNKGQFAGTVNTNLGVDLDDVLKTDGLNSFVNAKTLESRGMIEKLKTETIASYKANTLRRMSAGNNLKDLFEQVKKDTGLKLKNGDLIARNELKAFNSELSKKRAENVGIKKAIWRNAQDERVRGNPGGIYPNAHQDHWTLEGQEYVVGVGLKDPRSGEMIEPGEPINCRCVAEYIVEFD